MQKIYYLTKYITYKLFGNFKRLGWPVAFSSGVIIKKMNFMSFGSSIFIGPNCLIQIPDEYKDYPVDKGPLFIVGDKVTIGFGTMINIIKNVTIEKNVLIAPLCYIADHAHRFDDPKKAIRFQGVNNIKPVLIKEGAWIGTKATINPGVTIGKNAIVGANSVVTKDVPDYSVAVGSPAKVIKRYNQMSKNWERIN